MDLVKRTLAYVRRYWDFLLVDLLAFGLAYVAAVQVRRAMDMRITRDEMFLTYGAVALYFFVYVVSRSLGGVTMCGLVRKAYAVVRQSVKKWSLFTVAVYGVGRNQDGRLGKLVRGLYFSHLNENCWI